jgi:hypothetical protein
VNILLNKRKNLIVSRLAQSTAKLNLFLLRKIIITLTVKYSEELQNILCLIVYSRNPYNYTYLKFYSNFLFENSFVTFC